MLRIVHQIVRRFMPEKPVPVARKEGYRAIFNMSKEDLLLYLAEWVVEHDHVASQHDQQHSLRGKIEYLVEKIKAIRTKYWTERRPDERPDNQGT